MPERLPMMGDELSWALGVKKLSRKQSPPPWVRKAILALAGLSKVKRNQARQPLTLEEVASMMGCIFGITKGARMLFEHPVNSTGFRADMIPVLHEFQRRIAASVQGTLKHAEEALSRIPEAAFQTTPETMIAFDKAKFEAVEDSARPGEEEDSTTDQLLGFMWIMWPEVKTATSVQHLHEWISRMGFINGSLKLFEKVCRKIEYKGSKRGRKRKRRIPTKRG